VSWLAILVLAVGTYALKATGFVAGARELPPRATAVMALLPAALLAALAAVQTFGVPGGLAVDARAAGVAAAAIAIALRAPFVVVVAVAMVVAGGLRLMI
jgi:branched-subunit amino acid transport protein